MQVKDVYDIINKERNTADSKLAVKSSNSQSLTDDGEQQEKEETT